MDNEFEADVWAGYEDWRDTLEREVLANETREAE